VILDISMPIMSGIEAARQLRRDLPDTRLIFLTQYSDALYVDEARGIGVSGYVLKTSASTELLQALEAVQNGQAYYSPQLSSSAAKHLRGEATVGGVLTAREREVLELVAKGYSAKEVADALHISPKTVQFHKTNLTRKLSLATNADLVKYAIRAGITTP
jgi:DNA-binding NarL/FixJ family response regulator